MKKIFILFSTFSILNAAFAQIIDCDLLINIDVLKEKLVQPNSYSKEEILVNQSISNGIIISEKAIKLTNGSYRNSNKESFFIASISSCESMKNQNESNHIISEENKKEEQKILIYPNPSSNFVKVNWSNHKIEAIFLTTVEGRILQTHSITNKMTEIMFDISDLAKGIYQILLIKNGQKEVFKIIKN